MRSSEAPSRSISSQPPFTRCAGRSTMPASSPRRLNAKSSSSRDCAASSSPPATRRHSVHHSLLTCASWPCCTPCSNSGHSCSMRQPSSASPKPGRRHQPARLSQTRSWSAERRRPRRALPQGVEQGAQQRRSASARASPSRASSCARSCFTALGSASRRRAPKTRSMPLDRLVEARRQARCGGGAHVRLAAQLELELPALRRVVRGQAVHLQRAHLGQRGRQLHRRSRGGLRRAPRWPAAAAAWASQCGQVDQFARRRRRLACHFGGGGREVKAHRLADAQREAAALQAHFVAFLGALRQQADAGPRVATCTIVQAQEIAARRAAADPRCQPAARQCIGHGAARHGDVGVVVVQQAQRRAAPARQRVLQTRDDGVGMEDAAVEQQRVGPAGAAVLLQEGGDVARHRGVRGIGQAEADEAAGALAPRAFVGRALREEAVDDAALDLVARELDRARAADQRATAAQQRDAGAGRRVGGQQALLDGAAARHQLRQLAGAASRDARPSRVSAWWASARSMLSPPSIRWLPTAKRSRLRLAVPQLDAHQAQVGGAAADVADQHQPRAGQVLAQRLAVAEQPVVQRRLRLLEQAQRAAARRRCAACSVSARAASSNEAGTVSTSSCCSSGCAGWWWFQAARTCAR